MVDDGQDETQSGAGDSQPPSPTNPWGQGPAGLPAQQTLPAQQGMPTQQTYVPIGSGPSADATPPGYPPQPSFGPPPGYPPQPSFGPQPVFPPPPGFGQTPGFGQPFGYPPQPGNTPPPGFGPQPAYLPQPAFGPQPAYVPQPGFGPQPGYLPPTWNSSPSGFAPGGWSAAPFGVAAFGPPGPKPGFVWGGIGVRFGAIVLDAIAMFFVLLAVSLIAQSLSPDYDYSRRYSTAATTLTLIYWVLFLAYHPLCWYLFGASLGQKALGLRVVRASDGQGLGIGAVLLRYLIWAICTGTVILGIIAAAMAAENQYKQAWPDDVSKSLVIRRV